MPREMNDDHIMLLMERTVDSAMEKYEARLVAHVDARAKQLTDNFIAAFPGGDVHGHRAAHEQYMDRARKCATFKEHFISKVITIGLLGALGWACSAVWVALKEVVQR
jgi:hypothetical protein